MYRYVRMPTNKCFWQVASSSMSPMILPGLARALPLLLHARQGNIERAASSAPGHDGIDGSPRPAAAHTCHFGKTTSFPFTDARATHQSRQHHQMMLMPNHEIAAAQTCHLSKISRLHHSMVLQLACNFPAAHAWQISNLRGAHTIPCIKDGICPKPECSHLLLRRNKVPWRHMAHPMSWPDTLVLPKVPTEAESEQAVPSVIALDAVNAKK